MILVGSSNPTQPNPAKRIKEEMNRMLICIQHIEQGHSIQSTIIVIVFITCLAVTNSDLLLKPENSFAREGDTNPVILKCNSTFRYRLSWLMKACWSSEKLPIFNGYRLSKNVTSYCKVINGAPGKYYLNLTATKQAAQQYACQEPGTLMEASAELIIIESDPECNATTDGELATFTCHIRFHGNWAPVMEWTTDNSSEIISEGVNNTRDNESVTSRLVVPISQSHTHKINYTCTTKFRIQDKPSDATADNIPPYSHSWESPNYIAEPHKGADDDKANEEEKDPMVAEENVINAWAAAALLIIPVVALAGLIFFFVKRKTSEEKENNSKEEATEFI